MKRNTKNSLRAYFKEIILNENYRKSADPTIINNLINYYIYQDLYCADFEEFKEICKAILASDASNPIQIMVGDYDETIYTEDKIIHDQKHNIEDVGMSYILYF